MAIFDKSFIHSINADEAAVFDMHFMTNITPLFFVEVIADLEKANLPTEEARVALVRSLAGKTPVYHSYPNIHHLEIALHDLLGDGADIRGVPVVGGGRRVQTLDGVGTVFDEPPEMKAKARWHSGEFAIEDYVLARAWREMLAIGPGATERITGGSANRFSFRDLAKIKQYAEKLLDRDGVRFSTLRAALESLAVPSQYHAAIVDRWKGAGGPKLLDFAPYATHVLTVDLFRVLAMGSGHISPDKTSNYADMAYLYYLPFCRVFVSSDRLHQRCVPLFLNENQRFIWGPDLRPELARMVVKYLGEPDIEEIGLIGVAQREDFPAGTFLGDLFDDMHTHNWRQHMADQAHRLSPETEAALVARLKAIHDAPPAKPGSEDSEDKATSFTRVVPARRGRFPFMPRKSRHDG